MSGKWTIREPHSATKNRQSRFRPTAMALPAAAAAYWKQVARVRDMWSAVIGLGLEWTGPEPNLLTWAERAMERIDLEIVRRDLLARAGGEWDILTHSQRRAIIDQIMTLIDPELIAADERALIASGLSLDTLADGSWSMLTNAEKRRCMRALKQELLREQLATASGRKVT